MLKILNKLYHDIWFNTGYMIVSFIANLLLNGIGWGMVMLYAAGAATLSMNKSKLT
jgi:hypothetical protein